MQQYLFRGKRVDNGEWVTGYYVNAAGDRHYILEGTDWDVHPSPDALRGKVFCTEYFHEVVGETVGMWTSILDKNGNKIFEGDCVQFISTEARNYDEQFDFEKLGSTPVVSLMRWSNDSRGFRLSAQSRFKVTEDMLEVVGNCFDNPELVNPAVKAAL